MKLHVEIDGRTIEIETEKQPGTVTAIIDGRAINAIVSNPEPGVYLFNHGGRVYEAYIDTTRQATRVSVGGREFEVRIADPKKLRASTTGADQSHGKAEIRAAMPGKVVRVIVPVGAEVEKGDSVLVIEAMKMQNELRAPKAGFVREIKVAEGDTVGAGDVLATIE